MAYILQQYRGSVVLDLSDTGKKGVASLLVGFCDLLEKEFGGTGIIEYGS